MAINYEDQLLQAMSIIADNAVNNAGYDRTIQGSIVKIVDAGLGQYQVKYQDSVFTATASQFDIEYIIGTKVYVTISGEDEKNRIIIGTVAEINSVHADTLSIESKFVKMSTNILANSTLGEIGLHSYINENIDVTNKFTINPLDLTVYQRERSQIYIAAEFKTSLPTEQMVGNGDYGLYIEMEFQRDASSPIVTQTYYLHVNNMIGDPYRSYNFTLQSGIFDIPINQLKKIKKIGVYDENFPSVVKEVAATGVVPTTTTQPADIFVRNVELYFIESLTDAELETTVLKITAPLGSYFAANDTSDKLLEAELRVKGGLISDTSLNQVEYYWFKKDITITKTHKYYSPLGGRGWRCLNPLLKESTALDTTGDGEGTAATQFQSLSKNYTVKYDTYLQKKTIFKCVACTPSMTLSSTIVIYDENATNELIIESSEPKTMFIFPAVENLHLTAKYNTTVPSGSSYYWVYEADGKEMEEIAATTQHIVTNPNVASQIITYSVALLNSSQDVIAQADLTLFNNDNGSDYYIIFTNGDALYKYDTEGVSPASEAVELKDRLTIKPITFNFYDYAGTLIGQDDDEKLTVFKARWLFPVENTLIKTNYPITHSTTVGTHTYKGFVYRDDYYEELNITTASDLTFHYEIENTFNFMKPCNTIYLEITYQDKVITQPTNLIFTKEGISGTNGTKYSTRIVPVTSGIKQVYVQKDGSNAGSIRRLNTDNTNNIYSAANFRVQVWGNSELVATGNANSWTILPDAPTSLKNANNIAVNSSGVISLTGNNNKQAAILQAQYNYKSTEEQGSEYKYYYSSYCIPYIRTTSNSANYTYIVQGGWQEAVYSPSGEVHRYDNIHPFYLTKIAKTTGTIITEKMTNVRWEPSWKTINWSNGPVASRYTGADVTIYPPDKLVISNNYIYIQVMSGSTVTDTIIYPVHLYVDRYSMAAMNQWDGNNIEIDEDSGHILAPQIAAGKKESDNSFTGVAIGQTFQGNSNGDPTTDIGLFGYYKGQRSIFLDAKTGSAVFGRSDSSQIILDTSGRSTIKSDDFNWSPGTSSGKGMEIELSSLSISGQSAPRNKGPYIAFGSGRFYVTYEGKLHATDVDVTGKITATSGKIGNWIIDNGSIYNEQGSGRVELTSQGEIIVKNGTTASASTTFKVTNKGYLTSVSGKIGGWNIGSDKLYSGGVILNSVDQTIETDHWKIDNTYIQSKNGVIAMDESMGIRCNKTDNKYGLGGIYNWSGQTVTYGISAESIGIAVGGRDAITLKRPSAWGNSTPAIMACQNGLEIHTNGLNKLKIPYSGTPIISDTTGGNYGYSEIASRQWVTTWVNNQNYATQTWVNNKGYATINYVDSAVVAAGNGGSSGGGSSVDLTGYATQTWVNNQNFITKDNLTDKSITQIRVQGSVIATQYYIDGGTLSIRSGSTTYTELSGGSDYTILKGYQTGVKINVGTKTYLLAESNKNIQGYDTFGTNQFTVLTSRGDGYYDLGTISAITANQVRPLASKAFVKCLYYDLLTLINTIALNLNITFQKPIFIDKLD